MFLLVLFFVLLWFLPFDYSCLFVFVLLFALFIHLVFWLFVLLNSYHEVIKNYTTYHLTHANYISECYISMNAWSSTNVVLQLYWRDYIAVSVCTRQENYQLLSDYYRETEQWTVKVRRPSPWHWLTLRCPPCCQRARCLPPSSSPSVCKCFWDHIRYNTIQVYLFTHLKTTGHMYLWWSP